MSQLSPAPKPNADPSVAVSSSIKYKGVRKRKWGKWVSEIRLPNSRDRIWLGSYDSAEKAARAFDAAQFCLRGRSASFNFPNNPPDIPGGPSLPHADIQAAAARFANSTDHQVHLEDSDRSHSPSVSTSMISDWTTPMESDYFSLGATNNSRFGSRWDDILMTDHTNNNISDNYYPSEYGIFPGFDDLSNDFYVPTNTAAPLENEDENFDGVLAQEPFLWSF